MKKLLSNRRTVGIIITAITSILTVLSLIFMIQSYEFYSDEWGTDISFDSDYLVLLIISITLLIAGIYLIYTYNKIYNSNVIYATTFIGALLFSLYPLGRFFRALAKKSTYVEAQWYLYVGLVGLVLLGLVIYKYIKAKKALD